MTVDHDTIREWAEQRGGVPALAKDDGPVRREEGVLRIRFPGTGGENVEVITWEHFFEKFDQAHLAFMYQDTTDEGTQSRFFKLISRNGES